MANTIKPKRSNTASKVPNTSELVSGELGVNMADKKIYINNGTSIVQVGAGVLSALNDVVITTPASGQSLSYDGTNWVNSNAGAGDVVGAASSTDNAITRFDGTTGKIIQNSTVTLDDTGNIVNTNSVQFDITPTVPTATGAMYWDDGNKTPSVNLDADVTLQLGQENVALVYNGTGSTITNGSVVAVSGAQGQRPSVSLADADSEALSAPTLGIATEDIANGAEGFVTTFGFVRGINTSAFTAGAPIYLSQTAGQFTATRPSAPAHTVALGWVIKVNASSGEVFVNINNGWELDELHNVLITSPASGNTLIYDAVAGVWENANLTDGTGITITEGAGTITVANSGVLGVTATSPVASSGGQNPVISMPAATTSVSGYLTSTDWNTFNNKTSNTGTVTSVATGTGLSGGTITTSGTISLANTAVTAGSYTNTNITVDAQGRITAAANGSGGGVTSVTGTAPVVSSGGATPAISMAAATASVNGYMTSTYASKLDGIAAGATNVTNTNQLTNGAGFITSSGTSAACSGNAATATTLIGDQSNWASYRSSAVSNMLSWKNYGNGHIIFDASASTSPTGSAVNNTNSAVAWTGTYPTLMGWNGAQTYGVRVDSARISDSTSGSSASCSGNAATATALSTASGSAPSYSSRAWVNFNGYGTVAIRASGNVSSITDNGVGNYTINFTTAMVDANYAMVVSTQGTTTGSIVGECGVYTQATNAFNTPTTSAFRLTTWNSAVSGLADTAYVMASVYR